MAQGTDISEDTLGLEPAQPLKHSSTWGGQRRRLHAGGGDTLFRAQSPAGRRTPPPPLARPGLLFILPGTQRLQEQHVIDNKPSAGQGLAIGPRWCPPYGRAGPQGAPRNRPARHRGGGAGLSKVLPLPPELGTRPTGGQAPAVLRPGGLGWGRRLGSRSGGGRGPSRGSCAGSLARRPAGRCGGALARPQLAGRSLPAAHVTPWAPRRLAGGSAPAASPIGRRRASQAPPHPGPAPPRPRCARPCAASALGSLSCATRKPPNTLPGPRPAASSLPPPLATVSQRPRGSAPEARSPGQVRLRHSHSTSPSALPALGLHSSHTLSLVPPILLVKAAAKGQKKLGSKDTSLAAAAHGGGPTGQKLENSQDGPVKT
ncbi:uncharacterized protein LOC128929766 [Callithrix jacchus]